MFFQGRAFHQPLNKWNVSYNAVPLFRIPNISAGESHIANSDLNALVSIPSEPLSMDVVFGRLTADKCLVAAIIASLTISTYGSSTYQRVGYVYNVMIVYNMAYTMGEQTSRSLGWNTGKVTVV